MRRRVGLWVGIVLGCLVGGCGGKGAADPEAIKKYVEDRPIIKVAVLYGGFKAENKRPPENLGELKSWAKALPKDRLAGWGIVDVDSVCTSPRDKLPYVLAAVKPRNRHPRVLVYEQNGVDGKRLTASAAGTVEEMDENTLQRCLSGLQ